MVTYNMDFRIPLENDDYYLLTQAANQYMEKRHIKEMNYFQVLKKCGGERHLQAQKKTIMEWHLCQLLGGGGEVWHTSNNLNHVSQMKIKRIKCLKLNDTAIVIAL